MNILKKNIAVIRGDGIGPEIVNEALKVLDKVAEVYGHEFSYTDADMPLTNGEIRCRKRCLKDVLTPTVYF